MTDIRPIALPEKDLPLRADVSELGSLVGEMLVEQIGEGLLRTVETIRKSAILRREPEGSSGEGLETILASLTADEVGQVIHAFSSYLRMVNLAEKVHRIRRRRSYQRARSDAQRGSLEAVIGEIKAAGTPLEELRRHLRSLNIQPVFTAHPTEATRRTIQEKEYDIVLRLVERLNPELTPAEAALAHRRIRASLTSAWQTRLVPQVRPTVADELDNILFYVTDILYRVVPAFYESLSEAVRTHYGEVISKDGIEDSIEHWGGTGGLTLLRFGSWVGGDMDGNPNVTAATIEDTLARQRRVIVRKYLPEVQRLGRYLSQTTSEIGVSTELMQRLSHYAEVIPGVGDTLLQRHRDMPYRCLLRWVAARLEASLDEQEHAYESAEGFITDIRIIQTSLLQNKGENAGLFGVRRLLKRARTFGFHLMTLDVRQDAEVHRRVMGEWLGDSEWVSRAAEERTGVLADLLGRNAFPPLPAEQECSDELIRTLAVFRAISSARRRFGASAVGLFIISMTQGADDVLTALALASGSCPDDREGGSLDVAPLLETVNDLTAGPDIVNTLLQLDVYRDHLRSRGNRQVIMVGYSDSNKDSGIIASRWALQEAQRQLVEVGRSRGVDLVFFHGRGGTVSRGGGNLVNGVLGAPAGSVKGYMRLTEQGEVINQKYGVRPIALRNLELITGAVLAHDLVPGLGLVRKNGDNDASVPQTLAPVLSLMTRVSREKYRVLVYQTEGFTEFFRNITPIDVIERLTIGSRPPSRRSGSGISNLRAIPWVFSWAQTRIGFPGVFGVGTALDHAVGEFGIDALRELLLGSRFFQALVNDVEMVLAKSELGIGRRYAHLVDPARNQFFPVIEAEFALATRWILQLKQSERLLQDQHTLQRAIRLRNPYVDPLHLLQIDLLQRWRAGGREDAGLLKALMATVNGISLGIQNTG